MESNKIPDSSDNKTIPKNVLYLGLEITEPIENIHKIISEGLGSILESYPNIEDAKLLIKEIENSNFEDSCIYNSPWRYPKENKKWHLTTLFRKGNNFNKSHPAYVQFEEGKLIDVNIKGIVYVPKRIITSVVSTDTSVENKFPHITTILGTYSAKNSNDVLNELFSEGKCLNKEFKKLFEDELNDDLFVTMVEINLLNKKEKVYVVKFKNPIKLESSMKYFFK
jgi:hypothetical protein